MSDDERTAYRDDDTGQFTTAADAKARPHDTSRDTLHEPQRGIDWASLRRNTGVTGPLLILGMSEAGDVAVIDTPLPLTLEQGFDLVHGVTDAVEGVLLAED